MALPKTDDFRFEQVGDALVLTFTPDGTVFTFDMSGGAPSEPRIDPPRGDKGEYDPHEVRRTATALAQKALHGAR